MSESNELALPNDDEKRIGLCYKHGPIAATFDLSTVAGKRAAHNAIHGDKMKLKELIGETIIVQDILVYPRSMEDTQSGEMRFWTDTVLISPDSPTVFTSSPYVLQGIRDWAALHGPLPWKPAQRFVICKRAVGGGREMLYLEAVE